MGQLHGTQLHRPSRQASGELQASCTNYAWVTRSMHAALTVLGGCGRPLALFSGTNQRSDGFRDGLNPSELLL